MWGAEPSEKWMLQCIWYASSAEYLAHAAGNVCWVFVPPAHPFSNIFASSQGLSICEPTCMLDGLAAALEASLLLHM